MYRIEHTMRTYCTTCGKELKSARDASLCKRQHTLERVASTPEGRRILEDLRNAGFMDKPDPWI